jgi:hypothetical protein
MKKMKNQYNSIYIFCTFRGQLILLVAFIIINLFNVSNYAYAEGSNIGEYVGLLIKMQEDPTFIPQTSAEKAYLLEEYYKERAAFEGHAKNPIPLALKEQVSIRPFEVVPEKTNAPLFIYNSTDVEGSNLKEILTDIKSGEFPVQRSNQRKFVHILTELNQLELKYTNARMDQQEAMLRDIHKIFVNPRAATAIHYPDLHNFDARSNQKFYTFQEDFQNVYFATKGNPIMLEAITVYNKNIAMYNRLLVNMPISDDIELTCYKDLHIKFIASYKRFTTILAEVENKTK